LTHFRVSSLKGVSVSSPVVGFGMPLLPPRGVEIVAGVALRLTIELLVVGI
jgi:hypothetical protein